MKEFSKFTESISLDNDEEKLLMPLPTKKIEYFDGAYWRFLATEDDVNNSTKLPCYAATIANLVSTYANGTAGVGATLTSTVNAVFATDGVTPAVNSRILVKKQTNTFENGTYTLTDTGSGITPWILTRATDYDDISKVSQGDVFDVIKGNLNNVTSWMQTAVVTTIGTDAITFEALAKAGVDSILGTPNRIVITGDDINSPQVDIAPDPILLGTYGVTLPGGTTAQRPVVNPPAGTIRLNTGL